mmetsp:Transcript_18522/g.34598  ORF Transcript_18522/g.34598 Transcript_18522/m.34598 type:complete len:509 (+) Transcript_18522:136-1662(+)
MSSSLLAIRTASETGVAEQKRLADRKRALLVLIHAHLVEGGYIDTAERLQHEAKVVTQFDVADNMDLNMVFNDFEAYYEMRFDKKPKMVRKAAEDSSVKLPRPPRGDSGKKSKGGASSSSSSGGKLPTISNQSSSSSGSGDEGGLGIQGSSVTGGVQKDDDVDRLETRVLKPPPHLGADPDMKALAAMISREIYVDSPNVKFSDIIRLDEAKRLLSEAVMLPLRFPFVFTGLLRPWKGILLHGPPGTGKTMLAKAVATECRTTFFNISASTLVSKWRGDSEKLVRALFEVARYHSPSTIFLDEMDAILSARGGEGGQEHEASRRMKTELLMQMDGLKASTAGEQVFVMAASNLPWDLDTAVLRRLEKRVMVPLPGPEAREAMIRKHLEDRCAPGIDFSEFAAQTEGYSGADMELLCREAAMKPVRRLMQKLKDLPPEPVQAAPKGGLRGRVASSTSGGPCSADVAAQMLRDDPVSLDDFVEAYSSTRSSSHKSVMGKYEQWQEEFGSV